MTPKIKTRALVLQNIRWSDTSKIVSLFTEARGIVKAIAKGALRPKSPFRGVLENLNAVEVVLAVKETRGLQIVSDANLLNPFGHIRENLNSMAVALSILELVKNTLRFEEEVQELFESTLETLIQLDRIQNRHQLLFLLKYLLYLSHYLGFGWDFRFCRECGQVPEKFPVSVDLVNGGIICQRCRPVPASGALVLNEFHRKVLLWLEKTTPAELAVLDRQQLPQQDYQRLLDLLLAHLNYHTEQNLQLKSLKMYIP